MNTLLKNRGTLVSFCLTASLTVSPPLWGAPFVWDGDANGQNGKNWENPGAWVEGRVPGSSDNAIFDLATYTSRNQPGIFASNGNTPVLATVAGLQLNSGESTIITIQAGGGLTVLNTTLVQQSAAVTSGGVFNTNNLSVTGGTFTIPSVAIGGRLSGSGNITGNVNVSGTHSTGGSSTLTGTYISGVSTTQNITGNLNYASGSIFEWDFNTIDNTGTVNQGSYDRIVANGAVTGSSIFNIVLGDNAFTSNFWDTSKSWNNIFTGSGTFNLSSIFTSFGGAGVDSNGVVSGEGQFSFSGNTLNWNEFSAIPEPSSACIGLLICLGLLRRRRA